jgi:hypothetical protein
LLPDEKDAYNGTSEFTLVHNNKHLTFILLCCIMVPVNER